jgi:uncharacterized phage protein (TIGR01671 family)
MKREIKFRAWHRGHSKMYSVKTMDFIEKVNDKMLLKTETPIGYIIANLRQCELMQFTGLLDKNGKEIYHFDIVNNKWLVFLDLVSGVYLIDISNGDIIRYKYQEGIKYEITRNYFERHQEISQNCQGVIDKLISQTNRTM